MSAETIKFRYREQRQVFFCNGFPGIDHELSIRHALGNPSKKTCLCGFNAIGSCLKKKKKKKICFFFFKLLPLSPYRSVKLRKSSLRQGAKKKAGAGF